MGKNCYIPSLDFDFSISDVLRIANIGYDPGKERIYIRCPWCGSEHNRHLTIDLQAQIFACAVCHKGGGVLDFYSFLQGWELTKENRKRSLDAIKEKLGITPLQNSPPKKRQDIKTAKASVGLATVDSRDRVYQALLSQLSLWSKHKKALLDRGLSSSNIQKNEYKSFSSADAQRALQYLLNNHIPLLGIPGFYYNEGWRIKTFVRDGMFVPVREVGTRKILGMQIRFDNGKTRYLWFSETNKLYGTPISRWCHFVGPENSEVYVITEGALKADVIYELTGLPVIGLAGTGAIELLPDVLEYLQIRQDKPITLIDAFDMDFITNKNVSRDRERLHALFREKYFYAIVMWPPEQKGLDDYMKYAKEIGGIKKCRTICSRLILETRKRKQRVGKDLFLGYLGIL